MLTHQQVDLRVEFDGGTHYWVNTDSPKGYVVEKLLLAAEPGAQRCHPVSFIGPYAGRPHARLRQAALPVPRPGTRHHQIQFYSARRSPGHPA